MFQRFFGNVRSFGGHEDHPTIVNFAYIFRLLTLYTPIRLAVKGNVEDDCGTFSVLSAGLEGAAKHEKTSQDELHARLEYKLQELCSNKEQAASHVNMPSTSQDHCYYQPNVDDSITYYLAGYIVHNLSKHKECAQCIDDVEADMPCAPEACITFSRSFTELSLKHPSGKMFSFLRSLENTVADELQEFKLCSDIFWAVLDSLEQAYFPTLGCPKHQDAFTAKVLKSYVVLRIHFFAKQMSRKLGKSEETARARKRARLL